METSSASVKPPYASAREKSAGAGSGAWPIRIMILFVAAGLNTACTSMLPMTDKLQSNMSAADVQRIAAITKLPEAVVRDPTIHEVHEVTLSCWQMMQQCYPSVPLYLKLLGSVPLGCTAIYQQPWKEKVAIIYSCWMTDPITRKHERRHAKGEMHAYW